MAVTTPTTQTSVPLVEIGYAQAVNYNWWLYEQETTPELIWPQSIAIYDSMRRTDSQVMSVLRAVTQPIRSTPWRLDPNGARDEVVQFVANDLGLPIVGEDKPAPTRSRDRFSWDEHLRLALLMLPLGHSFFEQLYRIDPDGQRAHLAKLAQRPSRTIERIEVAPDGGLVYIQQWWTATNRRPMPIPVDRLVGYVLDREGGNWLGTSVLRSCYKNWLLKDRLLRVWAQTIERNGMGIPRYTGGEQETDLSAGLAMAKAWRSGETAGTAIPNGSKLDLVGVEGTLPNSEPAVRYHDEQIARGLLAHFLNLGTQTGSWALGSTFSDFFTLSLQTIARQIAETATAHVVEDLVDVNWGPDEPAPKICFDEIGSRPDAASLATLIQAGAIVSDATLEAALRQMYGLPPAEGNPNVPRPAPSGGSPTPPPTPAPGYGARSVAASAEPDLEDEDEGLTDEDEDAVEELLDALDVLGGRVLAAYNPHELRQLKGHEGGGQFARTLDGRVLDALKGWLRGEGSDRPLTKPDVGKPFTATQLRAVIERTPGLHQPPPRTSAVAMERQILDHARQVGAPSAPEIHAPAKPTAKLATPTTGAELADSMRRYVGSLPKASDRLSQKQSDHLAEKVDGLASVDPTDPAALRAAAADMRKSAESLRGVSGMRLANNPRGSRMHAYGEHGIAVADQFEKVADSLDRLARGAPEVKAPAAAVKKSAFSPSDVADRLRRASSEEERIRILASDPTLTAAKLRLVAAELGIDVPETMRAKSAMQLHIADKVSAPEVKAPAAAGPIVLPDRPTEEDLRVALSSMPVVELKRVARGMNVPTNLKTYRETNAGLVSTPQKLSQKELADHILKQVLDPHQGREYTSVAQSRQYLAEVIQEVSRDSTAKKAAKGGTAALTKTRPAADGLDALGDHQLVSLATEYEIPGARDKTRPQLLRDLRKAGAVSPHATQTSTPTVSAPSTPGPAVRRVYGFNAGPAAEVAQRVGRTAGDEPLYVPNRGADQGLVHLDSILGTLWTDLVSDNREPNSVVNQIAKMGEALGRGQQGLDENIIPELKKLRDSAPDTGVALRIQNAIDYLSAPPVKVDVPDNTPPAIRRWLEDIAKVPTLRKAVIPTVTQRNESYLQEKIDIVRRISSGDRMRMSEAERLLTQRSLHESVDGVYHEWQITDKVFSPDSPDWPSIRDWLQGKPSANAPEVAPSATTAAGDVSKMNVTKLRVLARQQHIKGFSRMTKAELLRALGA